VQSTFTVPLLDKDTAELERMRAAYGAVVFDEWALLSLGAKHGGVLAYTGPRVESFGPRVTADSAPLRAAVAAHPVAIGDLVFALEATGTRYDALLHVGEASYLVCNHTQKTMLEIRAEAGWLKAQAVLFELGEKFRVDPLVTNQA
jgi:methylaspartate ammonia-lyase